LKKSQQATRRRRSIIEKSEAEVQGLRTNVDEWLTKAEESYSENSEMKVQGHKLKTVIDSITYARQDI